MTKHHPIKTDHCLNCEQPLDGQNFCPHCGQKNDDGKLTVGQVLSEAITNLFAFDGRFFHTLATLFRYPGKVPRQFVEGKRVRFMNPVRIYFLSSLLMLTVMQIKKAEPIKVNNVEASSDDDSTAARNLAAALKDEDLSISDSSGILQKFKVMMVFSEAHEDLSASQALDSLQLKPGTINQFIYTQAYKASHFDQERFNEYVLSKAFWGLFLFIPIIALILKLVYIRRGFYYIEHLFFTFYTQSVFFLIFSIVLITGNSTVAMIGFTAFTIYLFLALRKFYKQGFFKTIFKIILTSSLMFPALAVMFLLTLFVAFIFY